MKTETLKQISLARRIILCTVVLYLLVFFALNASKISADNVMRLFYDFECVLKDKSVNETIYFEESDNNYFTSFKNGLVSLTNTGVAVYNEKNILISEFPANYTNSVIEKGSDNLLVFERGGNKVFRSNSFEVEKSTVLSENIVNLSVDNRGYTAIITDSYRYKGKLTVYNKSFEELYYWSSSSVYPMYSEFMTNDIVAVISVSPNKESSNIVVNFLNFVSGEEVGTLTEENAFPLDIYKNSDGSINILTADGFYKLTLDKMEKIIDNIGGDISYYDIGENYFVLAEYSDKSKNISEVSAYNKNGEKLFSEEIENLKFVSCNSEYVFISAGKIIYAVSPDGNVVFEKETDFNIQKIVPVESGAYIIGTDCAMRVSVN